MQNQNQKIIIRCVGVKSFTINPQRRTIQMDGWMGTAKKKAKRLQRIWSLFSYQIREIDAKNRVKEIKRLDLENDFFGKLVYRFKNGLKVENIWAGQIIIFRAWIEFITVCAMYMCNTCCFFIATFHFIYTRQSVTKRRMIFPVLCSRKHKLNANQFENTPQTKLKFVTPFDLICIKRLQKQDKQLYT